MRMNSILKAFIATTFGIGVLAGASQMASAQICPSSKLYYIVRDAKGTPSAAARADLRFQPFPGWGVVKDAFVGDKIGAPPNVLNGKAAALMTSEMCSFREEPTLKLTLDGKSMNLTFHTRPLPGYQSSTYLDDALPFQQGTFEIDVPNKPANRFYAASC